MADLSETPSKGRWWNSVGGAVALLLAVLVGLALVFGLLWLAGQAPSRSFAAAPGWRRVGVGWEFDLGGNYKVLGEGVTNAAYVCRNNVVEFPEYKGSGPRPFIHSLARDGKKLVCLLAFNNNGVVTKGTMWVLEVNEHGLFRARELNATESERQTLSLFTPEQIRLDSRAEP